MCARRSSPIFQRELAQHLVVEVDERSQELVGGIQLDRQPGLGEVDLDVVCSLVQASAVVSRRFAYEVGEERLPGIALDAILGVEKAQRRGRDHRLLDGNIGVTQRRLEVAVGMGPVAKGAGRETPSVNHELQFDG
jgi:hypothetical protein